MIRLLLFISFLNGGIFDYFHTLLLTKETSTEQSINILPDNLIPNPQFTDHNNCCNNSGALTNCIDDWFNVHETPDFVSPVCGNDSGIQALLDEAVGNTMIGGFMSSNNSESLGVCLTDNMESGKQYEFSINLALFNSSPDQGFMLNFYGARQCSNLEAFAENSNACNIGGSFQRLFSVDLSELGEGWTRQTIVFTAPDDIEAIFYATQCNLARNDQAYVFMDDLSLTETEIDVDLVEICDNGIDDDNNGLTDVFDPACVCENTILQSIVNNPNFVSDMPCCLASNEGEDIGDCMSGWNSIMGTPDLYQSVCLEPFIEHASQLRREQIINVMEQSDDGFVMYMFLNEGDNDIRGEGIFNCLNEPLRVGEQYQMSGRIGGRIAGATSLPPPGDYVSVYGLSSCNDFQSHYNQNIDCYNSEELIYLNDIFLPNTNGGLIDFTQDFTVNEEINAIVIALNCDLSSGNNRWRGIFLDNFDIISPSSPPTPSIVFDYNSTIQQVGTRCDQPIQLQVNAEPTLQYQWYRDSLPIAGATSNVYNVDNFDPSFNYHVFVSNVNGCELIGPHQLNIAPLELLEIDFLCEGDTHQFRDTLISDPGFYTQYVEGVNGDCDTIVNLRLTPGETALFEFDVTICAGENHFFNNETLTETGVYEERVPFGNGCDSITRLNLLVLAPIETIIDESICAGESYTFNNEEVNVSGAYQFTTSSSIGCDSTVILNLEVLETTTNDEEITICPNSSYNFHGEELTEAGTYQDTIVSTAGCDSIITLQLAIAEPISHDFEVNLCDGMRFDFNGRLLETSGTYFDTLQTAAGCDSAIMLILNVYGEVNTQIEENICFGDSYDFNGQQLTTAGIYKDTLRAATFCDSIVTLQLSVLQEVSTNLSGRICAGESYNFHGEMLSQTGIYHDTLQTTSGCDSVVTLQLAVVQEINTNLQEQICNGDNYNFNGEMLSTTGTYHDTLQTALGCDSIVALELTVFQEVRTPLQGQICAGDRYDFNGETLTLAGTYHDTLSSTVGCDSIVTLDLGIIETTETQLTESICEGTVFDFNGQVLDSAGTYLSILNAASGCDSLVRLELSITTPVFSSFETQICNGGAYFFNNQNLTQEGIYQDTLVATSGCDSIVELNLLVSAEIQTAFDQAICMGEVFEFNQQSFNSAGTYQDTLLSVAGCDSIVTLNLSVLPVNTTVIEATICANDTYLFNNSNLAVTGTYFDTLITNFGCDSIISLQLNVLVEAVGDTTYADIAFGESYEFQQLNYSQSGTYPHTLTDSNGCDSTVFLTLNVAPEPCSEPIDFIVETSPTNCLSATNGRITFLVSNDASPYLYSIDNGLTFQSDPQFNNLPHGSYPLLIEDADGCLSHSLIVNVLVRDAFTIELPSAYEIQLGDSLQLDTLYSNLAPATYTWTAFQPISCDTCARPFFKPEKTTTYQLTVTDAYGCTASDDIEIFVDRQSAFYLPNVFSPNGDGVNDVFNIGSRPNFIEEIEQFQIFNRWGELVFSEKNVLPTEFKGWDGTFEAKEAMQGVYVFMIRVKTRAGISEMLTGEVAVMR